MATLSALQRTEIWADLMRRYSADGESIGIQKAALRAAATASWGTVVAVCILSAASAGDLPLEDEIKIPVTSLVDAD